MFFYVVWIFFANLENLNLLYALISIELARGYVLSEVRMRSMVRVIRYLITFGDVTS